MITLSHSYFYIPNQVKSLWAAVCFASIQTIHFPNLETLWDVGTKLPKGTVAHIPVFHTRTATSTRERSSGTDRSWLNQSILLLSRRLNTSSEICFLSWIYVWQIINHSSIYLALQYYLATLKTYAGKASALHCKWNCTQFERGYPEHEMYSRHSLKYVFEQIGAIEKFNWGYKLM